MTSVGQSGGQPGDSRLQSAMVHSLIYVLMVAIVMRILSWFGYFVVANYLVTMVLLACWVATRLHWTRDRLCLKCIEAVSANAPVQAERQWRVLWVSHFVGTGAGVVTTVVVLSFAPITALITDSDLVRYVGIPGDLWVCLVIYAEWLHHRLMPWCPYCGDSGEGGEAEPSPDPEFEITKLDG